MRKQLLAYTITGRTWTSETEYFDWEKVLGVDLLTWNSNDLEGNPPFKIILSGETIPNQYTDITSIVNWDKYGTTIASDYLVVKFEIRELVREIGWENLNNEEKDIAIKYFAYTSQTDAFIYLVTVKGMNEYQAQIYLIKAWHKHHSCVLNSCKLRWYYAKFVVPQFLTFADAEDLCDNIYVLIFHYIELGKFGIEYEDKTNGIMDYIESTNQYENQGLRESGYQLLFGTWDLFIQELNNVLVQGIYIKYDDI